MKTTRYAIALAALPLLFASATATAVTCGTYSSRPADGGTQSKVADATVVLFHNTTMVDSKDGGRFANLYGDCGGTVSVLPDNSMYTVGNCTVADASGDLVFYHFIRKRDEKRGSFFRNGGTGKFEKEFGQGWFQQTAQDDNGATGEWGSDNAAFCK